MSLEVDMPLESHGPRKGAWDSVIIFGFSTLLVAPLPPLGEMRTEGKHFS